MLYIPRLRRISDVVNEVHEEDPFSALNRPYILKLIYENRITAMKYGEAWLINLDELYGYLQYGNKKPHSLKLPLKKAMLTSGDIVKLFREEDPKTIIRMANFRRFCKSNGIYETDNFLRYTLYDFNDFLMTINPKGISHIEPMPIIRRFEPAVNEMRVAHSDRAKDITWALAFKTVKESQIFSERYGKGWIMNYKEFEKKIMKALDEKD